MAGDPSGSSPHTRGALPRLAAKLLKTRIIPAYAGSTSGRRSGCGTRSDHPRIRGEHYPMLAPYVRPGGSSPHTRGAPGFGRARRHRRRIIPAYAGSTFRSPGGHGVLADHPRIRGEHCAAQPTTDLMPGSSPHTRGAPCGRGCLSPWRRIIPAYAGSTPSRTRPDHRRWDHPRIRGEHPPRRFAGRRRRGSSPHTRGARRPPISRIVPVGIIPAYAGSTRTVAWSTRRAGDHPRIRGEHGWVSCVSWTLAGSSPHTRGAQPASPLAIDVAGIIPAYAGSTAEVRVAPTTFRDHPRIRGEHPDRSGSSRPAPGSSPHTRGALAGLSGDLAPLGIIPAYAGST